MKARGLDRCSERGDQNLHKQKQHQVSMSAVEGSKFRETGRYSNNHDKLGSYQQEMDRTFLRTVQL